MGQRYEVKVFDDLTQEDIPEGQAETVTVALNGETRTLDLHKDNAAKVKEFLEPYLKVGRKGAVAATKTTAKASVSKASTGQGAYGDQEERAKIREWASKQGRHVSPRGRIPQDVLDDYMAQAS